MEGEVAFELEIDPYGEVSNCKLLRSSGIASLDRRSCAAIMTRARFYPAMNDKQEPVAGRTRYNTSLYDPVLHSHNMLKLLADLDADGLIRSCEWSIENSPSIDPMPICRAKLLADDDARAFGEVPIWVSEEEAASILAAAAGR